MTEEEMKDKSLEELFDAGVDMTQFIVEGTVCQPNRKDKQRKINLSMPEWMIAQLDAVADYLAVNRQAVINMWIADRLSQELTGPTVLSDVLKSE